MFENWTKQRAEQMNAAYAGEKAGERRAEFSHIVRGWIAAGKAEHALEIIKYAKTEEQIKLSAEAAPDEAARADAEDELKFLDELEAGVIKAMPRKAA